MTKRVLLLGGTAEARELAGSLANMPEVAAKISLAGRTNEPPDQGLPVRVGGFGGVDGLAKYLKDQKIDALIDATHPFANVISANAQKASRATGVPLVHINRPQWECEEDEEWIRVPGLSAAVAALPTGARAFSATGRGSLDSFLTRSDIFVSLRVVDPPAAPYPGNGEFVVARPPFEVADERAVLLAHRSTHLVVKNSGGTAARTKLTAAASLNLPIVVIDRVPAPTGGVLVADVSGALDWLAATI